MVNFVFSRRYPLFLSFFSIRDRHLVPPHTATPVKPLTFPFFASRKEGGTRRDEISRRPFQVFYGFMLRRLRVLALVSTFPRIFRETDKKKMYTRNSFDIYPRPRLSSIEILFAPVKLSRYHATV